MAQYLAGAIAGQTGHHTDENIGCSKSSPVNRPLQPMRRENVTRNLREHSSAEHQHRYPSECDHAGTSPIIHRWGNPLLGARLCRGRRHWPREEVARAPTSLCRAHRSGGHTLTRVGS